MGIGKTLGLVAIGAASTVAGWYIVRIIEKHEKTPEDQEWHSRAMQKLAAQMNARAHRYRARKAATMGVRA